VKPSAIEVFVPDTEGVPPRYDEPNFPDPEYMSLYRELVFKMDAEAIQVPGVQKAIGLIIRTIARDYVVRVIADHTGEPDVRSRENDKRMMTSFKLLLDVTAKSDLAEAIRTQYVIGLVNEAVRVIYGSIEDEQKALAVSETMKAAFESYVLRENKKMSGGKG